MLCSWGAHSMLPFCTWTAWRQTLRTGDAEGLRPHWNPTGSGGEHKELSWRPPGWLSWSSSLRASCALLCPEDHRAHCQTEVLCMVSLVYLISCVRARWPRHHGRAIHLQKGMDVAFTKQQHNTTPCLVWEISQATSLSLGRVRWCCGVWVSFLIKQRRSLNLYVNLGHPADVASAKFADQQKPQQFLHNKQQFMPAEMTHPCFTISLNFALLFYTHLEVCWLIHQISKSKS